MSNGTLPVLIMIRHFKDHFWIIPYRKDMTEKQIIHAIARKVESLISDLRLFDEHENPMRDLTAAERIVSHAATNNYKFWETTDYYSFSAEELKEWCIQGPTFDDAVEKAKSELRWWELTSC